MRLFLSLIALSLLATAAAQPDSAAVKELDELVVTGSNGAVPRRLLPYTVSVIDRTQLDASGNTQLLSVLSGRVPSLFVTERGILGFGVGSNGGAGHIKLRGVGGDRASAVLMMVDGQPQFAGIYSHSVADFYSKDYVEKVEVLRGPGSVLYGSNAMAGVINVITRKARRDGIHASLSSMYGSYNTSLSQASATSKYGRFSALASLSYDRTDGNIENFDFKQWSGYAKAGYELSRFWNVGADFTLTNFKGNDPVYPTLSNPESTDIYSQSITRGEASLSAANSYGSSDGVARVYYSYGNHYIDDPRHFHSLDDRLGILAYQNFRPADNTDITIGFDFDTYSGEIPVSGGTAHKPGAMATIERKTITEYSPYLTMSQAMVERSIILTMGLRMANSDMFRTQWVPQVGMSYSPRHLFTVKASAAMGYRNPSFRELYLYKMANDALQPEKMWNYEVSASKALTCGIEGSLTFYFSRGENMIQTVDMKNENTGSFINKGIELSLAWRALSNLSLSASYSFLHSSRDNLTGAPRHQYFLGADWHAFKGFSVSAELKGVGRLYVAPQIRNQSYALLNMKLAYDFCRFAGVVCRLDNITDARYVINRGYTMPGITALAGINMKF